MKKKILLKHQAIPLFTLFFLPKTEENTEAYSISGNFTNQRETICFI